MPNVTHVSVSMVVSPAGILLAEYRNTENNKLESIFQVYGFTLNPSFNLLPEITDRILKENNCYNGRLKISESLRIVSLHIITKILK